MVNYLRNSKKTKPIKEKLRKNPSKPKALFHFFHLIRGKILIAFTILMAIIISMQILSYINITNLEKNLREFAAENLKQQMHINNLASDIAKLSSHEQTYLITGDEKFLQLYEESKERIHTNLTSIETSFKNQDEELKILGLIQQFYTNYLSFSKSTIEIRQKYGFENAAKLFANSGSQNFKGYIDENTGKLIQILEQRNEKTISELEQFAFASKISIFALSGFAVILTISLGYILSKSIRRNTKKINESILEIAQVAVT